MPPIDPTALAESAPATNAGRPGAGGWRPERPARPSRLCLAVGAGLLGSALLSGCGSPVERSGSSGGNPQPDPVSCSRLGGAVEARHRNLTLTETTWVRADGDGHPAYCQLTGALNARQGVDGQAYAIRFELRLPEPWNERFLHQTNGGTDGVLVPATGAMGVMARDALARGFAVLSSDGGHVADDPGRAAMGLARGLAFGHDPQARRDFAGDALDALWPVAQTAVKARYARRARTHYLAGCGNGGRLGLVAARRHADRYDGILAGAPALHWPQAALQHALDWQQWHAVSPDPRQALSNEQLSAIGRQVLARCDGLDLIQDGQVNDITRCEKQFRWDSLQCAPGQQAAGSACLSGAQAQALRVAMAGPRDASGKPLYTNWPADPGIASAGWRHWRLRSDMPGWDGQPVAATVGSAALAHLFSTPPQPVAGSIEALEAFLLQFDWAKDPQRLFSVAAPFDRSAAALLSPAEDDAPRLEAWFEYGGKLMLYHGSADPAFSVNATTRWMTRLQSQWGLARADAGVRAYVVPGMGHCSGGPATDRFDALGALVDWVERGIAPDRIEASARPENPERPASWSAQRTRPLCPWPRVARYAGGDVESASSFRCVN